MALGIVEQAGRTDVGRQRSANEDSLVLQPPFFAVADGMGGARAGEVASAIAAEAFEGASDAGEAAEAQLARILREANRRIYDLAVTDESRRGMGTTLTAAKVHDGEVSLGHVGDSRAYRMRDGELEQITRDHSLVAELERSGQITPEAAEHHPQRSIITRALGPEPDVEVDTYTLSGRDGDLFLLCSDGLTSMISDDEVSRDPAQRRGSLDAAADALVRAANQSGGKDNITVVLFRLGEGRRRGEPTRRGCAGRRRDDRGPAQRGRRARGRGRGAPAGPGPSRRAGAAAAPPARPRRRRAARAARSCSRRLLGLALVAAALAGLYALSRQVYFVGTNDGGPRDGLPRRARTSCRSESSSTRRSTRAACRRGRSPSGRRERVLDHEWRSREDAVDLVRALERGQLEAAGTAAG